jgi:putative Mg2+ transporter-C (MgtC) family protein
MLSPEDTILRLAIAAFLGGLIGLERERLEWAAGLRTHMLVCLGSSLIMIVSAFGFADVLKEGSQAITLDPSRVAAQVVSGIGFLGAGTILFFRQQVIRGLTTAASLWTVAGIGLAVGGGLYIAAIFTTVLVVVILGLIKPIERRIFRRHLNRQLLIHVDLKRISLLDLQLTMENKGLLINEITLNKSNTPETFITYSFLRSVKNEVLNSAIEKLQAIEGVIAITLKK